MYSKFKITQTTPTIAALMGFDAPSDSEEINSLVYEKAKSALPEGAEYFDRVLIYNPDAIALWLYQKYTHLLSDAVKSTDTQVPLKSVIPPVTPVCFGSIYTGVEPEIHGLRSWNHKRLLTRETLFDCAIKAGKKCAIVAVKGCSIATLFAERDMDYFILDTYEEEHKKALEVIKEDKYDLVVVYNHTYDSTMHRHAPESEIALKTLEQNAKDFAEIINTVREYWKNHNTFYGFCPDHGCHATPEDRIDYTAPVVDLGAHGSDVDSDMNVIHMFGTSISENDC